MMNDVCSKTEFDFSCDQLKTEISAVAETKNIETFIGCFKRETSEKKNTFLIKHKEKQILLSGKKKR